MKKVMVSQEAVDFIRKMADEVEKKIIDKTKGGLSFNDEVVELLEEIKWRLRLYGMNDTKQTIDVICEGINLFIERYNL